MVWEEVDEFVFKRRGKITEKDAPRYTDNYVIIDGEKIDIHCSTLSPRMLAVLAKITGSTADKLPNSYPNGFLRTPSQLRFIDRGCDVIHEPFGKTYRSKIVNAEAA